MTRRNSEFVIHDGWQIVLTLDTKGNVKNRNLWGANQDELIATNSQFTLCDHLGSERDVVDAGGKVLNHTQYNALGRITKQTGKSDCVFGYTGKMFDDATGLQWNVNRWYDANVGRWISEDPIGFKGKDANLSRYVCNATTTNVDHWGLSMWTVPMLRIWHDLFSDVVDWWKSLIGLDTNGSGAHHFRVTVGSSDGCTFYTQSRNTDGSFAHLPAQMLLTEPDEEQPLRGKKRVPGSSCPDCMVDCVTYTSVYVAYIGVILWGSSIMYEVARNTHTIVVCADGSGTVGNGHNFV